MKCKKCRKQIPDGSKFCNHCGTPTKQTALYRRPDGLYEKIVNINGKRVAFRAKKEADVFRKISEYEEKQEAGPTFREVAEQWYDEHWETLSPTTQRGYNAAYEEILEEFGDERIKQLTHKDINHYIKTLPKTYARKTCLTRLQLINMICKFAVIEDIITENPCQYITVPKGHGAEKRRAPTSDEMKTIRVSTDITYKGLCVGFLAVFLLYTGLRKGEALALKYGDYSAQKRRLTVSKSVYFENNQPKIKQPKTEAGKREVIVPDFLAALIPQGKKSEYMFHEPDKPTEPMRSHFFTAAWEHWQEETALDLTAHQLRHGYATILHEIGVDVKDAQDLLGHADASTTQNIYTEVSERRKISTEKQINNYLQ